MRIGIDVRPALYGSTGIGMYVRELVGALGALGAGDTVHGWGHRLRRRHERGPRLDWPPSVQVHDRPVPARLVRWAARVGLDAPRLMGGVDVMHLTDYVLLPVRSAPLVATVHDVLFRTLPECFTPQMRGGLERWMQAVVARAARLLVPCERVRQDLLRLYGVEAARVDVVAHGTPRLAPAGVPGAAPVRDLGRYVLALGTLEPRKNLPRLLEAMDLVRRRDPGLSLVVVGKRGWLDEPIVAALAARPWARHEPAASRERIAGLLRGAELLAFPSLGEGFGLPVLEGAAAGVPVLVGAGTACADVGGEAVLAVDPRSVEALAEGLERLLRDPALRARLVAAGAALAGRHTWAACARATRACYAAAQAAPAPAGAGA
ncbi:MAG: glycosyltransferase family 4 protein [Planctomycetia bacterium]